MLKYKCIKCGKELSQKDNYCKSCGQFLKQPTKIIVDNDFFFSDEDMQDLSKVYINKEFRLSVGSPNYSEQRKQKEEFWKDF